MILNIKAALGVDDRESLSEKRLDLSFFELYKGFFNLIFQNFHESKH